MKIKNEKFITLKENCSAFRDCNCGLWVAKSVYFNFTAKQWEQYRVKKFHPRTNHKSNAKRRKKAERKVNNASVIIRDDITQYD